MWISEIKFNNFRPFYGEKTIGFDKNSQENFTVIEAKADTGKTSLLSAIGWCLYGKEQETHEASLTPFNITRKDEMEDGEIDVVSVEITLNEQGEDLPTYIVKRSMQVIKSGDSVTFPTGTTLEVQEWEGHDSRGLSEEEAINLINSLLLEDIHGFFLFEGEKLEKNFSFYNSDNIRSAIEKVSQIKQIANAIEHLYTIRDSVYSDKKSGSDQEMAANQAKITGLQEDIRRIESNLKTLEGDMATAITRKDEINDSLDKVNIPLIRQLNERRKDLQRINEELDKTLMDKKKDALYNLLSDAPLALSIKTVQKLLVRIEELDKKNELPPKIKNIYLNELLEKKMCVCTRSLDPKSKETKEAIEAIKKMLKQNDFSDATEMMIQGRYILKGIIENVPERITKGMDEAVEECKKIENEIKKNKAEIENIDLKLEGTEEGKVMALQEERKNLEASILHQNSTISRLKASIKMKEASITETRQENDRLGKKKKDYEEKRQIAEFLDRALSILDKIQKEILDEIRYRVEKTTFESFQSLHWDKDNYAKFGINESYELSLKDQKDNERIYNLSSGTKHVLLLSFISALIDVSGYRFPIFIDTPLANTDIEQRENIAKILPDYMRGNQVVLLMKDQEYNPSIRKILSPRVGKELRMIKTKGRTEVVKWK